MRVWAWITVGVALVGLAVLLFPLVEIQRDLRLANEQGVQARERIAELERTVANLKAELDEANRARTKLQGDLDEASSEIEKRQSEVERLSTELQKATIAKDAQPPAQTPSEDSLDAWKPQ